MLRKVVLDSELHFSIDKDWYEQGLKQHSAKKHW